MDAGERELLSHALVALAAGGAEICMVDGRAGIARGQDVVDSVAARTVGGDHRTALRGQAVIAVHIGCDAIAGQAELLREPHALMTTRARVLGQIFPGDRRVGILVLLDGVNAVAVRAHRRQAIAARNSLPVDAGHEGLRDVGVALAAGGRHVEFVDGRMVFVGGKNLVRAVAIGTHGGLLRAVLDRAPVHARLV